MSLNRPRRTFEYAPPDAPLQLVFKDQDLLVLNKPSGLLSVPGKSDAHRDSLETRVKAAYPDALLVHRLDLPTSGLMVFARNRAAQRHLGLQFEKRQTRKSYKAVVWGRPKGQSGYINLPLICDWPNRPLQMVDFGRGKAAQTHWIMDGSDGETARLTLLPVTGRSHQLRVHLMAIGHPILGDNFYAQDAALKAAPRLLLHAERLDLRHPNGGEWMNFEAPCPF